MRGFLARRELALLAALALLASLTEGLGLVMLVPILQVVGGGEGGAGADPVSRAWRLLGLPPDLGGLLVLFVILLAARAMLVQARILAEMATRERATARLRGQLFSALLHANWRFLSSLRGGDAMAAVVGQVEQAGFAMQSLLALGAALATLAVVGLAAVLLAPALALALAVGGIFVLGAYAGLRRRAAAEGERLAEAHGQAFGFFGERLAALRIVKSHGQEAAEARAATEVDRRTLAARLAHQRNVSLGQAALEIGAGVVLAGAVWLAVGRWQVPAGTLLPLVALFARAVPLLQTVQASWQNWLHARPALDRVATLLGSAEEAAEPDGGGIAAADPAEGIRVERACLHHPGRAAPALDSVDLFLPARTIVALSGPSGAGKSTLADLVGGMVLPDSGAVRVDGTALTDLGLAGWRRRVAYVQQEPVLFHASVRENLLWAAPDASEEAVVDALRRASADFVLDLPAGLETVVGDRGGRLSGGERQRIALARALLRDPALLILDEATSAVDAENEAAIARAIARLRGRLTILVISHGGALAGLADREIRLREGRIVTVRDKLKA